MQLTDALNILTGVSALALAVTVGSSSLKQRTINDLVASNTALKERVEILETSNAEKDDRISTLEETIDGYSELVRKGHLAGLHGASGGDSPAHSETTKNRGSR